MTCTVRPFTPRDDGRMRPLPLHVSDKAMRDARAAAFTNGERHGYTAGWRVGLGYGLLYGTGIGCAAMWALIQLGQLVGVSL